MKVIILSLMITSSLSYSSNCEKSGPVCGSDRNTYNNACDCQASGHQVNYRGACGGQQWVAQYDQKAIGAPSQASDLAHHQYAWGWNRPEV